MTNEIISIGEVKEINGKKYLPVLVSFQTLSIINKDVLGDNIDDAHKLEIQEQVHKDCLALMKEFKK